SPVLRKRALTASEGCAPTDSQYCTRSELSSMKLGCSLGWYLPISSIALPSRLFRASATMTRYWGVRIFPIRLSFSLTATGVVSPVIRCWAPDGQPLGAANPRRDRTWATSKLEGRLVHRWSTLQLCQTRKGSSARTAARVVTSIDAGRPVARGPRPRGEARGTTCPWGTRSPTGRACSDHRVRGEGWIRRLRRRAPGAAVASLAHLLPGVACVRPRVRPPAGGPWAGFRCAAYPFCPSCPSRPSSFHPRRRHRHPASPA